MGFWVWFGFVVDFVVLLTLYFGVWGCCTFIACCLGFRCLFVKLWVS